MFHNTTPTLHAHNVTTFTPSLTCIKQSIPRYAYTINASITTLLSTFCILGNSVIIIIFVFDKTVRNLNNRAVILLAITDLFRGTVVMITKTITEFSGIEYLPQPICAITACTSAFTFFFNPMILALIAFIRYLVIVRFSRPALRLNLPRLQIIVSIIFGVSILFSILPFLGVGVYEFSPYHGVCFANWEEKNRVFRSIFYIFVIGVAFPVLSFSYVNLLFGLKSHNRQIKSSLPSIYFRNTDTNKDDVQKDARKARSVSESCYDDFVKTQTRTRKHGQTTVSESAVPSPREYNEFTQKTSLKLKTARDENSYTNSVSFDVNIQTTDKQNGVKTEQTININTTKTRSNSQETSTVSSYFRMKMKKKKLVKTTMLGRSLSTQEYQMTRLMFFIFLAYIFCWFPAAVVNVLALIDTCNVPEVWYLIIVTAVEVKSCLNPLIYGLGNRQYRNKIKRFFKKYFT